MDGVWAAKYLLNYFLYFLGEQTSLKFYGDSETEMRTCVYEERKVLKIYVLLM